jgi:anti-anti-sigma factor
MTPTPFSVAHRALHGSVLVEVEGEIDVATTPALSAALRAAVDVGPHVHVDLGACDHLDCGGLAALLRAQWIARARGGDLVLRAKPRSAPALLLWLSGVETSERLSVAA